MSDYDTNLKNFMAQTGKSKVAIIVPLYGYWEDLKDNPLGRETLMATMRGVTSSVHQLYVFFVGEASRVPEDVQNYIVTQSYAGNSKGVQVEAGSPYAEYVREGMQVAHDNTDAAYFIVLNPWVYIQSFGIDMMVDRLNRGDEAKVISGYDLRPATDPDNFDPKEFEKFFIDIPREDRAIEVNFFGITRYAYEMFSIDKEIRTAHYLKWDIAQALYAKGYEVIRTQRLPIFVFEMDIQSIENPSDVESDKTYYIKKWGFSPEG